ncbi:MAG: NAD(P)H dehydrogenase, partial [Halanaerobium sp. MSAO_Bac5]
MNELKRAIFLIGSPKGEKSSSASLGNYILNLLKENDIQTNTVHIHSQINTEAKTALFLQNIERADLIILAAPLYVDTLPAKVIKALTLIVENKKKLYSQNITPVKKQSFAAILNCGFPEPEQNKVALKVYKEFAKEAGFNYLGGIAIGMGGLINGKALSEMGGIAKNLIKGLDLAADDLLNNQKISDAA